MFAPYVSSEPPAEGPPETAPISGTNNRNDLQGTDAADRILGLRGDDKLYGRDGDDLLDGGEGEDRMYGGHGDDTYFVDDRDDRVSEERGQGTDTVETTLTSYSLGRDLENLQYTGTRDFHGKGNDDDNAITGGSGDDRLEGRDGDDTITGGDGNDRMWGGDDSDTFVFAQGFGNDRIYDFDADPRKGQDMLDVSELGITAATFADLVDIDVTSGDTVITIGDDSITLLGVNGRGSNAITQADFIFA
jgi:Ca2+-binding RTX toxin-like protein